MACWHFLLHFILIRLAVAAEDSKCPKKCGEISIPYPFGIGNGCSIDGSWFNLTCNESQVPPKLEFGNYEILNISLEGQVLVNTFVASRCYNSTGFAVVGYSSSMSFRRNGPYTFSNIRNKFTALGCDTQAFITGVVSDFKDNFTSGCVSFCSNKQSVGNGTCSGIGCCQTSIPANAKQFVINVTSSNRHKGVLDFNPCSYAFLVADDEFQFNRKDLLINGTYGDGKGIKTPVVVDWVIGNQMCEKARENSTAYACVSDNSVCYNSTNGPGYRCKCSHGFQGNPYIKGEEGCTDIDECKTANHTCTEGKCVNTPGGFYCEARSDPPKPSKPTASLIVIILGVGSGLFFVLLACSFIYWGFKKRKLIMLKEEFFKKNGGMLLRQQISSDRVTGTTKIFSEEELKQATNNYNEAQIIGRGGNGTVYKGILPDHTIVAIKKSKIVDQTQIEDFINEVFILSQINHRNVVKLLGCCLETSVPLLVYEYISNGTLFQYIQDKDHPSSLSLANRLRIASETAGALDYLHFAASVPIFHRDVKSTNILLDDNLTAKVSDFGASRLVPLDQTQLNTLVQGTLGYLDPEYFQTGQLTEKSDVYSFGVVLVELLTGEQPICANRSQAERNLSNYFLSSMKDNRLFQVLEDRVVEEGGVDQLVAMAELAKRCLKIKSEERPTMKEVAMELEGLKRSADHPWVERNHEETQNLLGDFSIEANRDNGNATGQDSLTLNNHNIQALEIGR